MKILPGILIIIIVALGHVLPAAPFQKSNQPAQHSNTNASVNKSSEGVAVSGYDVVSYFDQKRAMKGDSRYSSTYRGATYHFISAEHRDMFSRNPEHFIPQFGGYCAYGIAAGHKAPADPEAWTIIDDKLYLTYNKQVQKAFAGNAGAQVNQANDNWRKLKE